MNKFMVYKSTVVHKKIIVIIACLLITACSNDKSEVDSEKHVELCVNFSKNSDEYQVALEKDFPLIPDPSWIYPDKVSCNGTGPCSSKWIVSFSLDFPHAGNIIQHYRPQGAKVPIGNRSYASEASISPIDSSLKLSPMQFEMLEIKFPNARDSLVHYYGRLLEGEWNARQANDASIIYRRPFYAKIIGECKTQPIVSSYCLSKNSHVLSQTEIKHAYPLARLFSDDTRTCSKTFHVKKTLKTKVNETEKDVLSFNEMGEVGKPYVVNSKVLLPPLQFISIDTAFLDFLGAQKKVDFTWEVVLDCDDDYFETDVSFAIGLQGDCSYDPFIINLDPNYSEYRQGKFSDL